MSSLKDVYNDQLMSMYDDICLDMAAGMDDDDCSAIDRMNLRREILRRLSLGRPDD